MDEKLLNDLLECSVCLERLDTSSKVLSCQHTFCKKCLDEIVATHKELRCPECRTLVECRVDELPPNVLLMRILEGMKSRSTTISPPKKPTTVGCLDQRPHKTSKQVPYERNMFARAMFDYSSKEPGDLNFKKGDMIILRQKVDSNWYQGEANGIIGIFPLSYVQVFPTSLPSHIPQCKALFDFKMNKEDDEGCLSFSKGDIITVLRRIDRNWAEGKISNRIGIFPLSFVDLNQIARALMKLSINSQPTQSRVAPPTPEEAAPLLPIELSTACQLTNTKNNIIDGIKHVSDNTKIVSENTSSSSSSTTTTSPNTTSPSDTTSSSPSRSPSHAHAPFVDVATNRSLPTSNPDLPKRHSFTNGVGPHSLGPNLSENNKRHSAEILSQDDIAVFSSPNTSLEIQSSQALNGMKDSKLHRHGSLRSHSRPLVSQSLRSKIPIQLPAKHVALYPYKPQKGDELELKRGQSYMVIECCKDGWYKGTSLKTNCSGVFPGNYVTPAKISMRLLSGKSNTNSSVQQQKEDHSSFNSQLNDCSFQSDLDDNLPLYPPPELPPRSSSPSVHSRVSSWLSEIPSTSSRVRSAPTHSIKSMCCNTVSSNTTKSTTTTLLDKDITSANVVNNVAGATVSSIASPSHSLSPENLAQKRVRKKCFLTNSVMRSFSSIKIRKSPPPMYSMDNPVFDDNTSNNVVVTTSQPVHTRSDSCPSKLLNVDIQRTPEHFPLKVKGCNNFKSELQPNGSSVLIHHRKSHSLDTNNGVSVDIKPQDRKIKPTSRAQQNMCRCIVAYPPNIFSDIKSCSKNEFNCSNGSCINDTKHCDGIKDCDDGSDEVNCDIVKCLEPEYYKCTNNKCIASVFVCDKENDCSDGSDESHCHDKSQMKPCTEEEFKCADGSCIPIFWHCDGTVDCDDGSDEDIEKCREKTSCTEGYLCKNLQCVSKIWRCDGKDDCGDGSDETHCDLRLIELEQCSIEDRKFLCHDHKKCINIENVCDDNNDCFDSSDEGGLCNNMTVFKDECEINNCSGVLECLRKPHGIMCVCPKGTQFLNNTCFDINECEEYGVCDQFCLNSYGKYVCSCDPNYELIDQHKCKIKGVNPVLVYSSLRQIKVLNLMTHSSYTLIDKLKQATGLAVDGSNIYWTIIYEGMQAIVRANKNDTKPEIIVTSGLGTPENLAIDSITHNLYFTDAKMKHIGVCNNDGSVCTVLHNKNIDKPRAIAVSPMDGFMYWTDWGENPIIARSGMDGSSPQQFVTHDIHWPNGIHVDYYGKRIYWVDAKMQTIESIKLDASDRRIVLTQSVDHPFSVTVFEDKLYWSDWSGKEIKVCNKFTGKDRKSLIHESKSRIYGMQIFHPSLFMSQTSNPCNTAKCSDICLLAPKKNVDSKGYTCACPDDKRLSPEGSFCYDMTISPNLIVGTSTSILEIEQEHLGRQKIKEIPLKNKIGKISAVTYSSLSGNIIIYDSKSKKLLMYDLIKMKLSDLGTSEIGSLYSLEFDNYGNNLYWCDLMRRTLDVLSLSTNTQTTIMSELDGYIPIAVALAPDRGFMFVAMKDGSHIHIDRIDMDGSIKSLIHVVEFGLTADEIALHFDMSTRRLYFTDLKNSIIGSVSEDGMDRKLIKNSGFVIDIVSMDNEIFWVSQGSKTLNWIDKNNNDRSSRVLDMENWKIDSNLCLTVVTGIDKNIQHPCQENNGGCSHVCLLSSKEKVCSCPSGLVLSKNGLECILLKQCKSDEYRCSTGECILSRYRCDSKQDCPHGDDEDTVKCLHYIPNLCPKSQFLCHDKSKCIDKKLLCDNVKDCNDSSDEKYCRLKHTCDPNTEFLCSTGECIQLSFLCDGNPDCINGQDELNCKNHTCHHMEFRCKSGTCIAIAWECDGEIDCVDGSDEHSTCATKQCRADQFSCNNGRCISHKFTCNGEDDCDDNSDENGCPSRHAFMSKPIKLCNEEKEFECENKHGHCVPIEARCNSTSECKHFEDELNCGCQKSNFFECNNKRCVSKDWLCDKTDDCGDQSDESPKVCDMFSQHTSVSTDNCDGYLCKNKECIPLDRVCNKKNDCKDGTDEGVLCGLSCQFINCSHICQETPNGGKCMCYHGFRIAHNGNTCKDIDECENNNLCSQYCTNLDGTFVCDCLNSDYMLRADKSSCKALGPTMDLVYLDANQIRSTSGDFKESKLLFSKPGIQISDFDIDIRRNLIYWTSEEAGTLICMNMQQEHKVYMKDLVVPTLVRIDWLTENVYFVENHRNIIVCNLNVKRCATIYNANIHAKIKAFVIDPLSGLMFWAESIWAIWNSPTTIIKQSDCSGHSIKTIIDHELHDVTDLAVDPIKHMVYWVDMVNSAIERANYDGSKRNMLIYTNHLPKKISLYEDKLFWTNDATGYSIFKCKVFATTDVHCESIPVQIFSPIETFLIIQQAKQINASNGCNHVQCNFICTSGLNGPMCICEDGSQVEPKAVCDDAGHRKSPTFKNIDKSGNKISLYVALLIIIMMGSAVVYYYLYHYKNKSFVVLPGFHFHNPLSTVTEVLSRGENVQHVQLEPGRHAYENPMNEEGLKDYAVCEVMLNYNDARSVYDSNSESRRTSS